MGLPPWPWIHLLCVWAQELVLMHRHWWPCPFSSRAVPTQVRGEADRRNRKAKEPSRWAARHSARGQRTRWRRGKAGAVARAEEERQFALTLFLRNCSYQERNHNWWQQSIERWRARNICVKRRTAVWFHVAVGGGGSWGGRMNDGPGVRWAVHPTFVSPRPFLCFSLLQLGVTEQ